MSHFECVGRAADFTDPSSTLVEVDDEAVVLVHAAGAFYALDDVCTHDGGPLSDGPIDPGDNTIACPRHGAKFALADGAAVTMPAIRPTRAHEVKVDDGGVWVRLSN
ncbi:MAG: Rieske 2Fe-2S domain-containing protein [Planctomycetota bacterium]